MIKIKVIDLLNKIAKGEQVPKKIKYDDNIYIYDYDEKNYGYFFIDHYDYLFDEIIMQILDDEIEIIEDKKIEKIETYDIAGNIFIDEQCFKYTPIDKHCLTANEQVFVDKINEIIDYLDVK